MEERSRERTQKRKRSRSPARSTKADGEGNRSRSRSPYRRKHHHDHHQDRGHAPKARLPFNNAHLHKRDLEAYRPLLAEYLDLQKQLGIDTLSEEQVRGRWKSFLRKWNAGQLAEGWYDAEVKQKADARWADAGLRSQRQPLDERHSGGAHGPLEGSGDGNNDDDDDDYGPSLPDDAAARRSGPAIPSLHDLQHRRELTQEEREAHRADVQHERRLERKTEKERLEELAPRADPGSRERQLEKKREATASNRAFADAKEGGADEVGDGDSLGGEDGVEGLKRQKKEGERRKNEREVRKEEVLRARTAEREERVAKVRAKEEKTMEMLRLLARQRFGGGGGGGDGGG